ncbi:aspartate aminotransferase family protein [Neptunicoccus sediminis]|uniref:aspartate aminotransferase family protein n=1 Tax=Neptunicoccus sediminis TaxID=1892596 RepID=UPI000845FFE1|nr:aminotransferase class III-fold pyridoxal phosphate-dependent enzyme [Neptunicoccus sediminis]
MNPLSKSLLARRDAVLGPNMSTFYEEPVHLVKGEGVWVWDHDGKKYLDCYNNVPHVGHCHPHVVKAMCDQAATLNTHTRYLHEGIVDYAERLTATFDDPLNTALLCCTGSEANDVALRMAEAVTGKTGIIVTDHTYHGNTTAVSALSTTNPSKFGKSGHIRHVPAPDSYRPPSDDPAAYFAEQVQARIVELEESGHGFAALLIDPFFANEGFPDLPVGFLDATLKAVHDAGGLLIADEVQPGFGRTGSHMWGHQYQGITPDVVTLGKPMGNGHPVAGVVTTSAIMHKFRTAFRYFNTFGGNPVSCATAMAVLDVIEQEGLMQQAADVGAYAKARLQELAAKHPVIGDVRGRGMFFGAELVTDRATKAPATEYLLRVIEELRKCGVLLNKIGIHYNTLKIRPNLQFTRENADLLVETLDQVLTDVQP